MLNAQKQLSSVIVGSQNTGDYFLLTGRKTVRKVKTAEKTLPVYTGPHSLICHSVQSSPPP